MVFVESYFYNKMEFLVFNSTVGRYVGYSDFGMALAHQKNEDKHLLPYEQGSVDRLCKVNALVYKSHGMDKTSEYRILIPVFFQFHVARFLKPEDTTFRDGSSECPLK